MEAPIQRVGVLLRTDGAHGEFLHGRLFAVVGQLLDDGKARAAVRAVDERIAVAAVRRVEQFAHAVFARCQIRRNERRRLYLRVVGKANLKGVEVFERHFLELNLRHLGRGRRLFRQRDHEFVQQLRFCLRMDVHAVGGIQHPAVDQVLFRLSVYERAEPHPLHDAFYMNVQRFDHASVLSPLNRALRLLKPLWA